MSFFFDLMVYICCKILLVFVILFVFEFYSFCNIGIYFIMFFFFFLDYIWEWYRSVWFRSNYILNGCVVCMELEVKGSDFLREFEVGYRVIRYRVEEDILGLF